MAITADRPPGANEPPPGGGYTTGDIRPGQMPKFVAAPMSPNIQDKFEEQRRAEEQRRQPRPGIPKAPPGKPKLITPTSGVNRYLVEIDGRKYYMTAEELEKRGVPVPEKMKRADKLSRYAQQQDVKGLEKQKKEYKLDDMAKKLSEDEDISLKEAKALIKRWLENPLSDEFTTLRSSEKTISILLRIAPISLNMKAKLNKARDKLYVWVGGGTPNPQRILKEDFDAIKKKSPTLADTLKRQGVKAYETQAKGEYKYKKAEYDELIARLKEAERQKAKVEATKKETEETTEYLDLFIKDNKLNLALAIEAGYVKESDYKGWNVTQAEIDRLIGDRDRYNEDKNKLEPYRTYGDSYSLADVLVSGDKEAIAAAKRLFPEDIKSTEKWIDENWNVKEGKFYGGEPRKAIVSFFRKLTPWHEEKGETLWTGIQSLKKSIGLGKEESAAAASLLGASIETPIPHDDVIAILVALGVISYAAATKALGGKKVDDEVINKIRATWSKKLIQPENVYMVDKTGKAMSLASLIDTNESTENKAGYILNVPPRLDTKKLMQLIPPYVEVKPMENIPPELKTEMMQNIPVDVFDKNSQIMIFKKVSPTDIDPEYGLLTSGAATTVAEEKLKEKIRDITKSNPDIDKLIKIKEKYKQTELRSNIAAWNSIMGRNKKRIPQELYNDYSNAYQQYLRKLALLEGARKSYIASLDPQPVRGQFNKKQMEQAAVSYLAGKLGLSLPEPGELFNDYIKRVIGAKVTPKILNSFRTGTKAQQQAAIQEMVQSLTQPATKTQIQTKVKTQTKTKPQTKTAIKTKVKTVPRTLTKEATRVMPQEMTTTAEMAIPATLTTTITGKPIKLPKGGTKSKEWTPEDIRSAIAWRDGIVVHAIKAPYRRGMDEKSFSVSKLPEGLVVMRNYKGEGSQQRSAKVTGGAFPSKLTVDVGNQDVIITRSRGMVRIRHQRDTSGTTSRTTIKKGNGIRKPKAISKKRGRVFHTRAAGGEILSRRGLRGY